MIEIAVQTALYGVLLPGLVATAIIAISRPWSAAPGALRVALALGPAILVGYVASQWKLFEAPSLEPLDITNWLPHVGALAALACVAAALAQRYNRWLYAAAPVVGAIAMWLLMRPMIAYRWSAGEAVGVVLAMGALLAVYGFAMGYAARVADGGHPALGAAVMVALAGGVAAVTGASGSIVIAQRAGAIAAGAGAVMIAGLVFPRALRALAAAPGVAVMAGGAIALSYFYAAMTTTVLALLLAAPVAAAITAFVVRSWTRRRLAAAVVLATALACTAAAAASAVLGDESGASDSGDDYGYGYE